LPDAKEEEVHEPAAPAVETEAAAEDGKQAAEKPQQSYLALTKLGMGKKAPGPKTDVKEKNPAPGKVGKRSITEMASSTLLKAGFAKS